ncbi:sugar ABC transporter substrate-binding protein [Chelativorans sp. AA-79]|uniref:ABC transporter substrate-binding protein n=1 Tax=Chelativorans sp. AA-79 TaxID=3028735 RepID=UPI0023F7A9F5|nr:sugar ABC transporter substrate-binding protein [Chelativorans sp. AA-79]WEX11063.1 sugar ABC transporter substrate-binding protein [Chelativorans sp. AA-79]
MRLIRTAAAATLAGFLAATSLTPAFAATLKFVSWQKDEKGVGDWWAELIKTFEEQHPGTTIEWTKVERAAYADTMTTLFAGGQPPQIVHLASFEFQTFADNGWLEDLGPWIEKAGIDMNGWAGQDTCRWNGETVCVMLLYFGYIMGYNEEILNEAGLEVPTSWEEFEAALKATTKDLNGDGIVDQFGTGHETKGGAGQYLSEMLNYVLDAGAYWTDKEGNITIDTPEMVEGLRRWKEVVSQNYTPRDMSAGEVRKLFADGKIALKLDGPWLYPIMEEGAAFDKLALAMPAFSPPVGGSSNVLAMASEISDEEKQLVWDFIALAMSPEFQSKYATVANSTPPSPNADVTGAEETTPHFDLLVKAQKAAAAAGVDRIPTGLELQYNEFSKMVQEEAQRMIIQDLDPAEVARTMQAKAEEIQGQ